MVIYSVLAILMAISAYKFGKPDGKKRFKWIKLLVTILFIIIVFFVIKKYYEVPIHYNKIKYDNLVYSRIVKGNINVNVTYDYNNSPDFEKSSYYHDQCGFQVNSGFMLKPHKNKLFPEGFTQENANIDSVMLDSTELSELYIRADNMLHRNKTNDFYLDSVEHAFRVNIWSSNRQHLYPFIFNFDWIKDFIEGEVYDIGGEWRYICDSLVFDSITTRQLFLHNFKYSGRQRNGSLREYFYLLEHNNNNYVDYGRFFERLDYKYPNTIFTGEDISSAIENFKIELSGIPDTIFHSLKFEYNAPIDIDIDGFNIKPDRTTMTSIIFTNPNKLSRIVREGLVFHVSFLDMKNTQTVRTIIATGVLGWLIGVLFSLMGSLMIGNLASLQKKRSWKEFFIISKLKRIFSKIIHGLYNLVRKDDDGILYLWKYIKNFCKYIKNYPFNIFIFLLIILIGFIFWRTIIFSDINPFDLQEGEKWYIFNIDKSM